MTLNSTSRRAMIAAGACLPLLAACAGSDAPPVNQFRTAGAGLACITQRAPSDDVVPGYIDCLRIGPVRIGQPAAEIKRAFGKPYKVVRQDGATALVYPIESSSSRPPYWVISIRDSQVSAIQLTGTSPAEKYAFSSIRLGDEARRIREILGKPSVMLEVRSVKATMWSYRPFPISIEVKDGRVYSMKVWDNAPRRTVRRR